MMKQLPLKEIFFLMWAIFKAFIELLTILFLFYALDFLAMQRVGILAP